MSNRINVLLLEENQIFSMHFALLLQRMGFKPLRVRQPDAAKFVISRGFSDLLIVGGQTGPEAPHEIVQEMRACASDLSIPILVVDAQHDPVELKACRSAGCQAFLTRPIQPKQLFEAIHDHLACFTEKRRNLRCEVDITASVSMGGQTVQSHRILSLSRGGARIAGTDFVPIETNVTLVLPLGSEQLRLAGTVLYNQTLQGTFSPLAFGVSFHQIDASTADRIDAYLEANLLKPPLVDSNEDLTDGAHYSVVG